MTALVELPPDLSLKSGLHKSRESGMCAMEAVAWLAGEPHSDQPKCACPVITAFVIRWNDSLPGDADRNRLLKPLLGKIIGTRSTPEAESVRAFLAVDWLVREYTPAWLDLVPSLTAHAATLRAFNPLRNLDEVTANLEALQAAAKDSQEALPAARSAARAAAWTASRSTTWPTEPTELAAWSSAWSAELAAWSSAVAWSAAESAVRSAEWSAAREAAEWSSTWLVESAARAAVASAAWTAVESAAWAAATSAEWTAVESAVRASTWPAARAAVASAVQSAVTPTTAKLQQSAVALIERMCAIK